MTKEAKKSVTISLPQSEADAVIKTAHRMGVSITMVLRMLIRKSLLHDPIKFPEKV